MGVYSTLNGSTASHPKEVLSCQHKTNPFKNVYNIWKPTTPIA
jgi:hypothetical protein